MPQPILVTGGFGFLGSYVCRALAMLGRPVVIYDIGRGAGQVRKLLAPYSDRLRYVQGSVSDLSKLEETLRQEHVEVVVHAAANCDGQALFKEPYTAFDTNTVGTLNVLEAARRRGVKRVVHSSSVTALAEKRYEPLDEAHPVFDARSGHPSGPYGASKAAAEIMGVAYWDAVGLGYIALRFSGIYGYGMRMPMYIKPMVELPLQGKPCHFAGGGRIRRSLIYVKDAADAVVCALDREAPAIRQRVFLVAGPLYELRQVAETVRTLLPSTDIDLGDSLSEYESRRLQNAGEFSVTQAEIQLGFRAKFDLQQGLRDYIAMYREYQRS